MRMIAYLYINPLLETPAEPSVLSAQVQVTIECVYQDVDGASRDRGVKRPQLQALLADCRSHPIDYLFVRGLDELGETLEEVRVVLQELEILNVKVMTSKHPVKFQPQAIIPENTIQNANAATLYLSDPEQEDTDPEQEDTDPEQEDTDPEQSNLKQSNLKQSNLKQSDPEQGDHQDFKITALSKTDVFQQLQDIQKAQRSRSIRKGHALNRVKALPPPGQAPYGYRRGKDRYALDRAAAAVVKDFFEYFLLYASLRGAVRYLAQKHGKKISVSTGQRWLTNPVYRGDLAYKNGEIVPNTHVAIISRDEAAQIDRLLRRNRRLAPRTASAPRSLAGLVFCAQCQSPTTIARVTTRGKIQEYLYLRPTHCIRQPKCKSIAYETILNQVIEAICEELPKAVSDMGSDGLDQAKAQLEQAIDTKQKILDRIPDLQTQGIFDEETAQLRIAKLRTEVAELRDKLAQLPPVNLRELVQAVAIPQFWIDLSESERRFFFREFIQKINLIEQEPGQWIVKLVFIF